MLVQEKGQETAAQRQQSSKPCRLHHARQANVYLCLQTFEFSYIYTICHPEAMLFQGHTKHKQSTHLSHSKNHEERTSFSLRQGCTLPPAM